MDEKQFSPQEVIQITASLLGSQPQDLIDKIEDNDLSTLDSLSSFLKPFAVSKLNTIRKESIDKGFRQASKRTEKLWGEVFNEDITGKKLDDLFVEHRDKHTTSTTKDKSKITLQQALQSEQVRQAFEEHQAKAAKVDEVQAAFEAYKNLQAIKQDAIDELTKRGAIFSSNPKVKALQMQALENDLSTLKFKRNADNSITLLDEDGESPLYNTATAAHWVFGEYLQQNSPLDFQQSTPNKEEKNAYVPSNNGGTVDFGFNNDHTFTFEDYERAKKNGKTEKADYVMAKMEEQAQQK